MIRAGVYSHYKGGLYQVLGVGQHTETNERVVVYVALTGAHMPGPRIRVRPIEMFLSEVEWPNEGGLGPRFQWVGDEVPQ